VLRPNATRRLTCGVVVVELRGFEPLTPCMPCHPQQFTQPSATMPSTTSALLDAVAGQGAMVGREATCGSAADNLLTAFIRWELNLPGIGSRVPSWIWTREDCA
jgi:hypothetical protein